MSYSMSPGPRRRVYSNGQVVVIVIVVLLVMLASSMLLFATVNYQFNLSNARSTATAWADASQTAFEATSTAIISGDLATAQVVLTSTAQANMTATAKAYANATATAQASATAAARATGIAEANATATAQALARDPYPPYTGVLALNDPLLNNTLGYAWDVYSKSGNNSCQFAGGAYESTAESGNDGVNAANDCTAENTNFNNFTFQADVTIVNGSCAGISFRGNSKTFSEYEFITCLGGGFWELRASKNGHFSGNIIAGYSAAIHPASGQTNLMAVVAIGQTITLYANGQELASLTDTTFSAGQIGLEVSGIAGDMNIAAFRNAEVWV